MGGRWVYAVNLSPNGEEKHKAGYVAKEYCQIPHIDICKNVDTYIKWM